MKLLSFLYPITLGTHHSKINGDIQVVEYYGKKIVYADGVQQSGGTVLSVWKHVVRQLKDRDIQAKNILVMGVAGGNIIQLLRDYYPHSTITGIEIDPVMIEIGKKYFHLDTTEKLILVADDVLHWVKYAKKEHSFDLIIIDVYLGQLNPAKIREDEFLKQSKKLLESKGVILYNCHYKDPFEYEKFTKRCKKIFKSVDEVYSYLFNKVLLMW